MTLIATTYFSTRTFFTDAGLLHIYERLKTERLKIIWCYHSWNFCLKISQPGLSVPPWFFRNLFWNPKLNLSMFKVLARTWLKKRNKTDTRHDKSRKLHILIYTINLFIVLLGLGLKNEDTNSNLVQVSYPDVPRHNTNCL